MEMNTWFGTAVQYGGWGLVAAALLMVVLGGSPLIKDIFDQLNYRLAMKNDDNAHRHRVVTGLPPSSRHPQPEPDDTAAPPYNSKRRRWRWRHGRRPRDGPS